ncbi:hypothetical protein CEXT_170121 [Caerostris extrusa]|uniref:Uncharacterized protein n=1 Tax=Caerostris extrusa TaxID=172846 RepID=A0AAV4TEL6_CAEEX|nr:hypothetical protein CEXT_170121 [Caerostris extrusa]
MSYYEQTTEYPTEIPEGLAEHDLPENTTKSSPASSKSLWQSFLPFWLRPEDPGDPSSAPNTNQWHQETRFSTNPPSPFPNNRKA